jgi:hypothetical protein
MYLRERHMHTFWKPQSMKTQVLKVIYFEWAFTFKNVPSCYIKIEGKPLWDCESQQEWDTQFPTS